MNGRLAMPARMAASPARRLRGIAAGIERGEALMLAPCGDVHTFGLDGRIDVAFVDASGIVVGAWRDVGPMRRLRCRGAVVVVERWADGERPWFEQGDRLTIGA